MRQIVFYVQLQIKKGIKIVPVFLLSVLFVMVLIGVGVFVAFHVTKNAGSFQKLRVAVVIPDDSSTSKQVMSLVAGMDTVSSVCDFVYMEEGDADSELEKGQVAVELIVSPDFYNDVNEGVNSPVTVKLADGSSFESCYFAEMLQAGTAYIRITEASIYALDYVIMRQQTQMSKSDMETLFTNLYVDVIIKRDETFQSEILSPIGEYHLGEYYMAAVMVLIMAMLGICFGCFYRDGELQVFWLLRREGFSAFSFSAAKTLAMSFQIWVFANICYIIGCVYSVMTGTTFLVWNLGSVLLMGFVSVSIASYFHCIYSLFQDVSIGALGLVLCNAIMCFMSGICFPLRHVSVFLQYVEK